MTDLPGLIAHADWSKDPRKRWMTIARRRDRQYVVGPAEPVGSTATLLRDLRTDSPDGRILVGFDFPIGLPAAYARTVCVDDFREVLSHLGTGKWCRFFEIATSIDEIDPYRPFYPYRPGGTRRAHLLGRLGLECAEQLLRRCERPSPNAPAAGALFWTLGAKQAGRAAIAGWREVLQPALRDAHTPLGLWPFDGGLLELLSAKKVVVCETYPALAYPGLGLPPAGRGWSKREPKDRRAHSARILALVERQGFSLKARARQQIEEGFGPDEHGEDPFDAMMGLLFMLTYASTRLSAVTELAPEILRVEGWILGRSQNAAVR